MKNDVGVTTLSTKGQVVIPKSMREKLNLKPGTPFVIRILDGKIILEVVK